MTTIRPLPLGLQILHDSTTTATTATTTTTATALITTRRDLSVEWNQSLDVVFSTFLLLVPGIIFLIFILFIFIFYSIYKAKW